MRSLIKYFVLLFNAIVHRDTSPKVVFYHDIGQKYTPMGTPETLFWSHMEYVGKNIVAFDDGFRGIWDHRESMRLFDVHPIVFIAIALVGQPGYLTWDEIRTLQNDYGVDFQSHTWSHQTLIGPCNPDLPTPSDPNFRTDAWYHHELVDSKSELEKQLNIPLTTNHQPLTTRHEVTSLCFPVGYYSDDVVHRCTAAGYKQLYASYPGNLDVNKTIISRCLCQFSSLSEFKLILNGGMNPLRNHYLKMHYVEAAE